MMYVPLIALGVTIVVGALGYYYFRAGRRKTELRYDTSIERVLSSGGASKITIDDKAVGEPYEVRLWVQPAGIKDVTSGAFDDGSDLALDLGVPLVTSPTSGDTGLKVKGEPGDSHIVIPPQILKCGALVYASMIVDGRPSPNLRGALADVDLVEFDVADVGRQTLAGWVRSQPAAALAGLVASVAAVAVTYGVSSAISTRNQQERAADTVRAAFEVAGAARSHMSQLGPDVGADFGSIPPQQQLMLRDLIRQAVDESLDARGIGTRSAPVVPTIGPSPHP